MLLAGPGSRGLAVFVPCLSCARTSPYPDRVSLFLPLGEGMSLALAHSAASVPHATRANRPRGGAPACRRHDPGRPTP